MEKKLLQIINHYGYRNQLKKLSEELYELQEAIRDFENQKEVCENIGCKELHTDKEKEHITEELADVMVMLEQFKLYYGISSEEITKIFWSKVDRQLGRMKEMINNDYKTR